MGMNTTQNTSNRPLRTVRPVRSANGKISAMSMVKALIADGIPAAGIKLTEQLTAAERAELGL